MASSSSSNANNMGGASASTPSSSNNPNSSSNTGNNPNNTTSSTQQSTTTTTTTANNPTSNNQLQQQQQQQQQQRDVFLSNDYYPLQQANKAIISALRADEVSSNGDLYKRIATSTVDSSKYNAITANAGMNAGVDANGNAMNVNGNGHVNGHVNGTFGMNGMSGSTTPTNSQNQMPQSTSSSSSKNNAHIHPTLKYTNSIPLPPYITQIIQNETKMSSLMGILPQGNMVWVSVDSALYLWEYGSIDGDIGTGGGSSVNGTGSSGAAGGGMRKGNCRDDFVCFKVPSGQCVVSVGLVRPKKGVFKDIVEWCLVVTTHEEAIICALARESMMNQPQQQQHHQFGLSSPTPTSTSTTANSSDTHLKLIPTRYLIPTDSIPMLSICGTDDGRIFMGGYDGCLYEMSYEGYVPSTTSVNGNVHGNQSNVSGGWYEENDEFNGNDYNNDNYSVVNTLATGSKRALSSLLFGPSMNSGSGGSTSQARPRKCRKVNHTSLAPRIVSAFVPGFVLNAASFVFGSNSTASGGPIVKLTLDDDRKTMYALTSKGFIHAFDLDVDDSSKSSNRGGVGIGIGNGTKGGNTQPKLSCTINVSKSIRRYLDCVAHGKMYAPSMTGTDGSIAAVHFPGGAAAAQAGLGGMEGARSILKIADSEMMRKKQKRQAKSSIRNGSGGGRIQNANSSRRIGVDDGCLHPISIHVIPPSESKFLTLVAVSTAGLRYYLSVLPEAGTSRYGNTSLKPGRRFSLCHIRAPPPLSPTSDGDVVFDGRGTGVSPWLHGRNGSLNFEAKNGCYTSGVTLLAIDSDKSTSDVNSNSTQKSFGDSIVVMTPDYTSQDERDSFNTIGPLSSYMDTAPSIGTNGLSEIVSQPMRNKGSTKLGASIMAGGHIWDITVKKTPIGDHVSPSILNLYSKSLTPSDSILESKIVPPFVPSSALTHFAKMSENRRDHLHHNTSLDAARSATERQSVKTDLGFFNGGIASATLNIFSSLLFNKPVTSVRGQGKVPTYLLAKQVGSSTRGFSSSALEKSKYGRKSSKSSNGKQSQRLQSSLLNPSITPLPEMSLQHLIKTRRQGVMALNSGGLHYFSQLSPVDKLQAILMDSNSNNVGKDENVKSFFSSYGRVECCSLCLSVAIDDEANDKLTRTAVQAALRFANRPSMIPSPSENGGNLMVTDVPLWNNVPGYEGYTFKPSSLHDGLLALTSRLLRPIWCKPAVVVTEGKVIYSKRRGQQRQRTIPAKVELLLDEPTLDRIRRPLARLQFLMKEVFQPAVNVVPGTKPHLDENSMMTDDSDSRFIGSSNLMTSAVQYQTQSSSQNQNFRTTQYSEKEMSNTARLYEERSIHATYRIVSRTVQLLTLMSHLRRAHGNPELPEVDFGYLHGLTYSQLVTSKVAQERIDTVLTNLFTDNSSFASFSSVHEVSSSVESNNLSSLLSNQCYLYFSIGSRLTHLGFSNAQSAMSQQPSTRNRVELTNSASSYLRQAATHWHNPLLICGQMDGSSSTESMTYEEMAVRAHESGSPLARAAFVLMELSDVVGLAEVCLICASNFGGVMFANESSQYSADRSGAMMTWEMGLYHRPTTGNSVDEANSQLLNSASSTAIIIGNSDTDTRKSDAQRTCHAVLFYYLNSLLKSAYEYQQNSELAAKMLSVATASTDINFLKELFGYLASSGHVDTLLKIDSPSVESWLENINKDPDLVWRYYVIHGMHWLAGEFMWKRGSVPEENLRIEERIQCLNRAANSYSDALTSSQNSMMTRNSTVPDRDEIKRIINQIREQIDVAELQSRVLSVITSSKNASQLDTQKMHILSSSLVNVSDLYNDYAAPLALYDLCLAIMQTCRCDDTATIITLWRSILCEELLPCRTGSKEVQIFMNSLQRGSMMEEETIILTDGTVTHEDGDSLMLFEDGEWISSVKHRVISLGKELQGKGAEFVFPIEFIAEQLEGLYCVHKCVSRKQAAPWTLQTLIEAGTSFPSLIEAYSSIVVAQEPDAPNPITKLTQLSCISKVLKQWISSASAFGDKGDSSSMQLKRYTPSLLQQIDAYKSSLESIVGWNSQDVSNLYAVFSEIEESLRRNDN